jgi:succinate dehydrogenase flavin-adding protein (antitoxin of CptAB toxin-antitoxin module)
MANPTTGEIGRLRWRMMRRGLLELDLVFQRFLDTRFAALTGPQYAALTRLVDYEDTDLWALLSGRSECADAQLVELVDMLRGARAAGGPCTQSFVTEANS